MLNASGFLAFLSILIYFLFFFTYSCSLVDEITQESQPRSFKLKPRRPPSTLVSTSTASTSSSQQQLQPLDDVVVYELYPLELSASCSTVKLHPRPKPVPPPQRDAAKMVTVASASSNSRIPRKRTGTKHARHSSNSDRSSNTVSPDSTLHRMSVARTLTAVTADATNTDPKDEEKEQNAGNNSSRNPSASVEKDYASRKDGCNTNDNTSAASEPPTVGSFSSSSSLSNQFSSVFKRRPSLASDALPFGLALPSYISQQDPPMDDSDIRDNFSGGSDVNSAQKTEGIDVYTDNASTDDNIAMFASPGDNSTTSTSSSSTSLATSADRFQHHPSSSEIMISSEISNNTSTRTTGIISRGSIKKPQPPPPQVLATALALAVKVSDRAYSSLLNNRALPRPQAPSFVTEVVAADAATSALANQDGPLRDRLAREVSTAAQVACDRQGGRQRRLMSREQEQEQEKDVSEGANAGKGGDHNSLTSRSEEHDALLKDAGSVEQPSARNKTTTAAPQSKSATSSSVAAVSTSSAVSDLSVAVRDRVSEAHGSSLVLSEEQLASKVMFQESLARAKIVHMHQVETHKSQLAALRRAKTQIRSRPTQYGVHPIKSRYDIPKSAIEKEQARLREERQHPRMPAALKSFVPGILPQTRTGEEAAYTAIAKGGSTSTSTSNSSLSMLLLDSSSANDGAIDDNNRSDNDLVVLGEDNMAIRAGGMWIPLPSFRATEHRADSTAAKAIASSDYNGDADEPRWPTATAAPAPGLSGLSASLPPPRASQSARGTGTKGTSGSQRPDNSSGNGDDGRWKLAQGENGPVLIRSRARPSNAMKHTGTSLSSVTKENEDYEVIPLTSESVWRLLS